MRKTTALLATVAAMAGPAARADTVDVSSTTFLTLGQRPLDGQPNQAPSLGTVVPVFELLNISAHNVTNPVAQNLELVVSGWGSYNFDTLRWDNGVSSRLTGDLVNAYIGGRLLNNTVQLRLGREFIMGGVARGLQLDGGEAIAMLPFGLRASGYVGVPVTQRFTGVVPTSWNPQAGSLAYGGRLSYYLALPGGFSGRGLDLGASVNWVNDGSNMPVRQEVGADARLMLLRNVIATGFFAYSVYDERISEGSVVLDWRAIPRLDVNADFRFTAPDLLLSRQSILSVFSASSRKFIGGGATYELAHGIGVGANYHLVLEPGSEGGTYYGNELDAKVDWHHESTRAGAEFFLLDAFENGYYGGRLFGRQDIGRFFGTADVMTYFYRHNINGQDYSVIGILSAGVELAKGFSAVVSGSAGANPLFQEQYSLLVKLAYNANYRVREVK